MTIQSSQPSLFTTGSAPGAAPLLGHALQLQRRPLGFLNSLPQHGDLVEIRLGPRPAYVVCHPDLVHQVLTDSRTFDKGGPIFDKLRQLLGNGLGTSAREPHRRQRRLIQPAFHSGRIEHYAGVIVDEITAATHDWVDGKAIDAATDTYEIVTRVLTRTMFSADFSAADAAVISEALPVFHEGVGRRMTNPFTPLEKLPTRANRRYNAARARLHSMVDQIIGDYRRGGRNHDDVLSLLMSARDEDGGTGGMTDQELHEHVITFLVAGVPTSAAVLAWALYFLGQDRDLEARLHAEVDGVLGDRPPDWGSVPRLGLTSRILTEVMRFYPPGWMLTRVAMNNTALAGHRIPAGTVIVFSPYLLHHRADLYPDPERFDPDRWLPNRSAHLARNAYIPFGIGSRKCIGDTYGMVELTLALATITARWRLLPIPGPTDHLTDPHPTAVIRPAPLPMRLEQRQ